MSRSSAVASMVMLLALPATEELRLTGASSQGDQARPAASTPPRPAASTPPRPAASTPTQKARSWDFLGLDLNGREWSRQDLDGKVVLLDFWATWCAPCLAELPHLRRLDQRFADDDLVILGIALDAIDRPKLRSFLLRHNVSWPQVHERDGIDSDFAKRFAVEAVPATVLLDRQGRIVARDLRGEAVEAVISVLIDAQGSS